MAVEALLGALPPGWTYATLGEACQRGGGDIQTGPFGSQLHAADYVQNGVPSIMPANIGDNRVIEDGIARISEADAQRLQRYRVRVGDIIYSRRGDVERRALIRSTEDGWLCGTGCLRVRLGDRGADPNYAAYYLGHPSVREWIVRHAHGATMANLNTSILSNCPFVLPPPEDQRAIGSVLGALDDKIELNRQMNETLEALARAIFKSWFVDFDPVRAKSEGRNPFGMDDTTAALFPDRFGPDGLPEGWCRQPLVDVTDVLARGIAPSYIDEGGIAVINQRCVRGRRLDLSKARRHDPARRRIADREVKVGDVLVNSTGQGTLGRVAYVLDLPEPAIVDGHVTTIRANPSCVLRSYLGLDLTSREPEIEALGEGSTGQTELSRARLGALPVLLPPLNVQEAYESIVAPLMTCEASNNSQSSTLATLRDLLLPKLISGEIAVGNVKNILDREG